VRCIHNRRRFPLRRAFPGAPDTPFSRERIHRTLEHARSRLAIGADARERKTALSLAILEDWLAEFYLEAPMPAIRDAATGEPMLLITDHYEVRDAAALERALAACADVKGNAQDGWGRLQSTGAGGFERHSLAINRGRYAERIEVFYRTQGLADAGRPWFEAVAGDAVRHLSREIVDPTSRAALDGALPNNDGAETNEEALDPAQMTELMAQVLHDTYARWSDEPIPALDGKTPRQALATPAGEERVRGLIRLYEHAEADQARRQRREPVSYDFLWQQIGLPRDASR
jgi:hypothetical protein